MTGKLKERIAELEGKYNLISDNLIDAVFVLNGETLQYEYVTPSIEKISGYKPNEFKNLSLRNRIAPESFQKAMSILREEKKRFEQGIQTVRAIELEVIHKDGSIYWVEVNARFLMETNAPLKIIGIIKEITERKKAEQQQNELIDKLGKALAEKELLLKEVKVLRGLLPICSGCKRIRDDNGKWWPLDAYVKSHTDVELTHTICSDCKEIFYGDLSD